MAGPMKTAEWIKNAREAWGKTQADLADAVGVSKANVSAWERGKYEPKLEHLIAIADATGVELPAERHHIVPMSGSRGVNLPALDGIVAVTPAEHRALHFAPIAAMRLTELFAATLRPSRPSAMRLIHSPNDDMSPTFGAGDPLVIDIGVTEIAGDGVYLLRANDRLMLRRVRRRLDGKLEASCDGPTHQRADVLPPNITVVGRVLCVWRGLLL